MSAPSFHPPPAIILAAKRGDVAAIRRLAQGDASKSLVEAKNTSYLDRTALHYAAEAGNVNLAKLLANELGATVDAADRAGDTPLHLALQRRRREVTEFLVDSCGANVHRRGRGGNTALHYASEAGEVDAIEFLLRRGASARRRNDGGRTPKDVAFRRKGMMELTDMIQETLQRSMDEEDIMQQAASEAEANE